MKCSDNIRASTVLITLTSGVEIHGQPERIRTDLGGDNVDIYIVDQHASTLASYPGSNYAGEKKRAWYLSFAVALDYPGISGNSFLSVFLC